MLLIEGTPLILASSSKSRADLLLSAGLDFTIEPVAVDEESLRAAGLKEGVSTTDMASALAEAKASRVSMSHPGALVIGGDQILECEGKWLGKPKDQAQAKERLKFLSGRKHQLVTAGVVYKDSARIWHYCSRPEIEVSKLSDEAIDQYLDAIGDAAFETPGVYQIEKLGAQILSKIDGCPYAVLGLPLLELLGFLREHGLVYGEQR